ncbi:pyrroline-5-carboxylate reductase [Mycoplasma sp. P36-A1]|uniref:pyrroline-5-carboxylate reductase n=1 Tax=Mycoplasma sp. P36-A1 TaxID=3252900 RepID=UPI003C2EDB38
MRVGFIGAGNMGGALIKGLIENKKYEINICDHNLKALTKYEKDVNITTDDASKVINESDIIILAIKPHMYKNFLIENKNIIGNKLIVSIAAGISSNFMSNLVSKYLIVMPNTPASVNLGMTSIVDNDLLNTAEKEAIADIFGSIGEITHIEEKDLELMITIAGSSPAYFELVIEAMSKFAVKQGMDEKSAYMIAAQVMNATSMMQLKSDLSPRELTTNVCSPNGTTEKAVKYFDNNGLADMFDKAMQACFDRAKEMKRENDESLK